jgi:hypothetical protein
VSEVESPTFLVPLKVVPPLVVVPPHALATSKIAGTSARSFLAIVGNEFKVKSSSKNM